MVFSLSRAVRIAARASDTSPADRRSVRAWPLAAAFPPQPLVRPLPALCALGAGDGDRPCGAGSCWPSRAPPRARRASTRPPRCSTRCTSCASPWLRFGPRSRCSTSARPSRWPRRPSRSSTCAVPLPSRWSCRSPVRRPWQVSRPTGSCPSTSAWTRRRPRSCCHQQRHPLPVAAAHQSVAPRVAVLPEAPLLDPRLARVAEALDDLLGDELSTGRRRSATPPDVGPAKIVASLRLAGRVPARAIWRSADRVATCRCRRRRRTSSRGSPPCRRPARRAAAR